MASKTTTHTNITEEVESLQALTHIVNHCYAFTISLAIRSVVELHIPDIIHSHGRPMTVTEIASKIESSKSPNIPSLGRVMRATARKNIFTVTYNQENKPLYGLTTISKWLRLDSNSLSFAPMFLALSHPTNIAPYHQLSNSIKEGGMPFMLAHGDTLWEKSSKEPEYNDMFNSGMAMVTRIAMNAVMKGYNDGFSKLEGTLVDVGGGTGSAVAEIVKAHPHIEGINFDLPHVVATAPPFPGVTHVGGDMFAEIPKANTIFAKTVLHNWGDEDCIKILKNFKKAISETKGKVVLVEMVLEHDGEEQFEDAKLTYDIGMMTIFNNGKERTENDWKKLLNDAGFTRYNIIGIPALVSVIEAFPQ